MGVALDPAVVHGQLAGAAHGVGGALFEHLDDDDDGQPLTGGLRDYHVPARARPARRSARSRSSRRRPGNPLGRPRRRRGRGLGGRGGAGERGRGRGRPHDVAAAAPGGGRAVSVAADPGAAARAVEALRAGGFVVLAESRDADADASLTIAADVVTAECVNFMSRNAYGLIRLCLTDERCDELRLHSAGDRRGGVAADGLDLRAGRRRDRRVGRRPRGDDPDRCGSRQRRRTLVQPGHVFPLRARARGGAPPRRADARRPSTSCASRASSPAAAISARARRGRERRRRASTLGAYAERHGAPLVTVADVIAYPARAGEARRAGLDRAACRRATGTSAPSPTARSTRAPTTSRSCAARSPAPTTCSSASRAAASPGDVFHGLDVLLLGRPSSARSSGSAARSAASSST